MATREAMPTVRLGDHEVSRLIVGASPVLGFSYMGGLMARFMVDYYTPERIQDLLVRCLDAGINAWQTSPHEKVEQALTTLRESGGDIHWIFLAGGRLGDRPEGVEAAFEFAFGNIKATDGAIVGMFPRFRDEPAEDASLTRRLG